MALKEIFKELVNHYSKDELLINSLWNEIEKKYSLSKRYYHSLFHLEKLIEHLREYKNAITDWHTIMFAAFYHDVKKHAISNNADTNLFTDADLSVLGESRDQYEKYCFQVRREYAIYPDIVYKPGRKKVISHFLQMERIFKTTAFSDRYEKQARENLHWEPRRLKIR
jgi:predicted metal-dependent HD superfamily phosphohydrolase